MREATEWSRDVAQTICRNVGAELRGEEADELRRRLVATAACAAVNRTAARSKGARVQAGNPPACVLCRVVGDVLSAACDAVSVEPRRTEMAVLVREVLARARVEHPNRWLTYASTGDGRGEWDPHRIRNVLSTMIEFALDGGDPAEPVRVVWLADSATVLVEVENDSLPLAREDGSASVPGRESVGWLDLMLARGIARAHGGELDVRDGPGGGTVVFLTLPRGAPGRRLGTRGRSPDDSSAARLH